MTSRIWRIITRAREERKYSPITFTFTQEQINYLQKQPNASKLMRQLLDAHIKHEGEKEPPIIKLQNERDRLTKDIYELKAKKDEYFVEHRFNMYESYVLDQGKEFYEQYGGAPERILKLDDKHAYIPLKTDAAKMHMKALENYDKMIKALEQKKAAIGK